MGPKLGAMIKLQTVNEHLPRQPAAIYRLRVAGVIPSGWQDRLGCLRVVQEERTESPTTTTLMGAIKDQADLIGVINTLHQLHLSLLLVEAVDLESIPA